MKISDRAVSVAILAMLILAAVSGGHYIESASAADTPTTIVTLLATQNNLIEGQYETLVATVIPAPGVSVGSQYGYTWTIYDGATPLISGARSNLPFGDGFALGLSQLTAGLHSFQAVYSSSLGYPTYTSRIVNIYVLTRQQATQNIIDSVNVLSLQGVLNGGQDNSLVKQLQHAVNQINAGKYAAAIGILNSFISEVNDLLSSGVLSPSQAAQLTSAAESVIATL